MKTALPRNLDDKMRGEVSATCRSSTHSFSKIPCASILLLAGLGVEGDAHSGATVQNRYLMRKNSAAPNLRQVHLFPRELLEQLSAGQDPIEPGALGENITTRGLNLSALPRGTRLAIGATAILELTGLRDPCKQLDKFRRGLVKALLVRDTKGKITSKAGVMAIVITSGEVTPGDPCSVELPSTQHVPLEAI
jgi:MOSC domain-containing protein YiiM